MRIPIPERIPWKLALLFIAVMWFAQIAEGTEPAFAALCALYFAIYTVSVNACGGLLYPSGAWIFFFGLLTAIIGLVAKAILLEPAQTHLYNPDETMLIYCAGMAAAGIAASTARRLSLKKGVIPTFTSLNELKLAAIGCFLVGTLFTLASFGNLTQANIVSAGRQLNYLNRMAIILATLYEVRRSGGKRSYNWVVLSAGGVVFVFEGLITFGKEGLFAPFLTWGIAAIVSGANFSRKQMIAGAMVAFFLLHYLVPYSQYGRRSRYEVTGIRQGLEVVSSYLLDLNGTRQAYLDTSEEEDTADAPHLFNQPQGFLDRENMIAYDDALIHDTDEGSVFGLSPVFISYINIIPHFIWPNKPFIQAGNNYGRELGVIDSDDESTGISFSPVGDAYHEAKWVGVLLVLPMVVFIYGFVTDSLTGNVRSSPWALLEVALAAKYAGEALLEGTIYLSTVGAVGLTIVALLSRYVMPLLAKWLLGGDRTRIRRSIDFSGRPLRSFSPVAVPAGEPLEPG